MAHVTAETLEINDNFIGNFVNSLDRIEINNFRKAEKLVKKKQ